MIEPSGVVRYWPAVIPFGYRLAAFDSSGGEPVGHRLVYADSTFERWLCADASELYPDEPWHGPSMGREISLAHGPAWLITDPRWIQGLVLDRRSPAYKLTWRHGDVIAELVVSTTIDEAEACRVGDQARFDGNDLLLGWTPEGVVRVDAQTGVDECPCSLLLLRRERLDHEHDSRIVVRTRIVPPDVPMARWTPTGTVALRPGADALTFTDSRTFALWWRPNENVVVEVEGTDAGLDDVLAIAEGLLPVPENEWEEQCAASLTPPVADPDDGLLEAEWVDDNLRPVGWARFDDAEVERDDVLVTGAVAGVRWQLRLRRQRPFGLAVDLPPFLVLSEPTLDRIRRTASRASDLPINSYLYLTFTPRHASPLVATTPESPPLPQPFMSVRPLHLRRTFVVVLCSTEVASVAARYGLTGTSTVPSVDVPGADVRAVVLPVERGATLTEITALDNENVALASILVNVPGHDGAWLAGNRHGHYVTDPWSR